MQIRFWIKGQHLRKFISKSHISTKRLLNFSIHKLKPHILRHDIEANSKQHFNFFRKKSSEAFSKFKKIKKHVFEVFSLLKNEKARFWSVFKFTKWKTRF